MEWTGGYFENKNFLNGTMSIAEAISKNTQEKSLIQFWEEEILLRQLIRVKINFLFLTYQQQVVHF